MIPRRRPWRSFELDGFATLEWGDWFRHRCLLEPIGEIPPAEAAAGIARLLERVKKGLMDAGDASLRERLVNLRFCRDELADEICDLSRRLATAKPMIPPQKIEQIAVRLQEKLSSGSPDLKHASARLLLCEVHVDDRQIRIISPSAVLPRNASAGVGETPPSVLSFGVEWRTRKDSNL